MNIPAAWRRGYTGKNVVVTVLDDGIERVHPDLIENYVSLQLSATDTFLLLSHRNILKDLGCQISLKANSEAFICHLSIFCTCEVQSWPEKLKVGNK